MDDAEYLVVKNHEEQYALWLADLAVPAGWQVQPARGSKAQCLDYVREHWTDMRPASLRQQMGA
ncbi:MbtH family protein [Roseateles sp. DB2]|uniref:MbtH family protein n=1 Tax=Roseateles sp. DB2 TaxID=3453717 RepID=UPI003EF01AB6